MPRFDNRGIIAEMSRPAKPRASGNVHAIRISDDLYDAIVADAGGPDGFAAWIREMARERLGRRATLGASERRGGSRDEGWRAGWAAANATFRHALKAALSELK